MNPVPALMCAFFMCAAPQAEPVPSPCPSAPANGAPSAAPSGESALCPPSEDGSPPPQPSPSDRPAPSESAALDGTADPSNGPASSDTDDPGEVSASDEHTGAQVTPAPSAATHRPAAAPAAHTTAAQVLGNISTGLLLLLGVAVLVLRLSVGWPRFPTPYLGRRRRGVDRGAL